MQDGGLITKVYVDVVLLTNFIMDFFILWATKRVSGNKTRLIRLVMGAIFGAFYSLMIFLPECSFIKSMIVKIIWSVIMLMIVFFPISIKKLIKAFIFMYIISFGMGGAVFAFMYLIEPSLEMVQVVNGAGVVFGGFNYAYLTPALAVALIMGTGGTIFIKKSIQIKKFVHPVNVQYKGKKIYMKALLDTGNQLVDPLTNKPVVVVEAKVLESILPEDIISATDISEDTFFPELAEKLDPEWSSRLRLIPFNSVGKTHGMMLGFRPDAIEIEDRDILINGRDVVVGLLNRALTSEGKYQALLNPVLFE